MKIRWLRTKIITCCVEILYTDKLLTGIMAYSIIHSWVPNLVFKGLTYSVVRRNTVPFTKEKIEVKMGPSSTA